MRTLGFIIVIISVWANNANAQENSKQQMVDSLSTSSQNHQSDQPNSEAGSEETSHSVCDNIECSGHGVCVVKGGEPVCACQANYTADQKTGLNCVPITYVDSHTAPLNPYSSDGPGDSEDTRIIVLHQEKADLKRTKRTGAVLLTTGLILTVCGGLAAPISIAAGHANYQSIMVGSVLAGVVGSIGLSMFIPGIALVAKGRKGLRKLQESEDERKSIGLRGVGIFGFKDAKLVPGLSLNFSF